MNFEETPIQKDLRELTKRFAEKELAPIIATDEKTETFRPELILKLGALGLCGIPIPEKYNGAGLGYSEYAVVIEELAAINTGYAISLAVTGLPQVILNTWGNNIQKQKYIPPLATGKAIGAFSLTETLAGSDAANLRSTAVLKNDSYIINGTKLFTTQADIADTIILMARTGRAGPNGISAFIVEKKTSGLTFGKRERKMGCHTSHTVELVLQDLKIPKENLIGKEGEGFKIAMQALDSGRITIGAGAIGIAKAALKIAIHHAKQREQFGKKIAEFEGVSFMLADMATELKAASLLIKQAAWLKDEGKPFTTEAAMAKLFSTDMAMKVTTQAVQILGGSGYTQDFPLERYMREAKVMQIVEGTNQIQRMIIGRNLCA
ncbi:MAG: acyl-CoA dehydrogenase family protein [Deltaproteobacteria bacterium]|nr:acyl-CoA dehydrogenase family protein [Deltaproteobacteria bacterium]